mmetsp:Transcript_13026/g.36948  ORF Transcript_13026/g.36948 Transcript_13026/m.36948 type:complete len:251 (+) Transcript_13026:521-1273(+)
MCLKLTPCRDLRSLSSTLKQTTAIDAPSNMLLTSIEANAPLRSSTEGTSQSSYRTCLPSGWVKLPIFLAYPTSSSLRRLIGFLFAQHRNSFRRPEFLSPMKRIFTTRLRAIRSPLSHALALAWSCALACISSPASPRPSRGLDPSAATGRAGFLARREFSSSAWIRSNGRRPVDGCRGPLPVSHRCCSASAAVMRSFGCTFSRPVIKSLAPWDTPAHAGSEKSGLSNIRICMYRRAILLAVNGVCPHSRT